MAFCEFCKGNIPKERNGKYHKNVRYCSVFCIKRNYSRKKVKISTVVDGENLQTCTGKGLYFEKYANRILHGTVVSTKVMNQSVDIILKNGMTVDVKATNLYKRINKRGKKVNKETQSGNWAFIKNKNNCADFYFCIGLVKNEPKKIWMLPKELFNNGKCIGFHSVKFDQYAINTLA